MSVSPSTGPATPGQSRPRLAVGAVLSRSLRGALMLALVAAGVMLLQTYREMLHETPASPAVIPPIPQTGALEDALPAELLRPGAWAFGENAWSVALLDLAEPANEARRNALGSDAPIEAAPSPLETKVLAWLKASRPAVSEGCRVYNVMAGGVRIRGVTRSQGKDERLRLVQILWTRRGAAPQMLEVSPVPTVRPAADKGHLLPMPPGAASLARRWDESGRLSGEILGPSDRPTEVLARWSREGWSSRLIQGDLPLSLVELRREGRTVHVCTIPAGNQTSSSYLLLSVAPTDPSEGNR